MPLHLHGLTASCSAAQEPLEDVIGCKNTCFCREWFPKSGNRLGHWIIHKMRSDTQGDGHVPPDWILWNETSQPDGTHKHGRGYPKIHHLAAPCKHRLSPSREDIPVLPVCTHLFRYVSITALWNSSLCLPEQEWNQMHAYHNLKVISTFSEVILLAFLYSSEKKVLKTRSASTLVCLGTWTVLSKDIMFYFVTAELYSYSFRAEAPTVNRIRLILKLFSGYHKHIF